jgi:hypothetical protein
MSPKFNEGEIAITTNTKFRENLGKVVRLKAALRSPSMSGWLSACARRVISITSMSISVS